MKNGFSDCEKLEADKYKSSNSLSSNPVFGQLVEGLDRAHQRLEWVNCIGKSSATLEHMILSPQSPSQQVDAGQPNTERLTARAATIVSERFPAFDFHDIRSMVEQEIEKRRLEIVKIEEAERELPQGSAFPRFEYMPELQRDLDSQYIPRSQPIKAYVDAAPLPHQAEETSQFIKVWTLSQLHCKLFNIH